MRRRPFSKDLAQNSIFLRLKKERESLGDGVQREVWFCRSNFFRSLSRPTYSNHSFEPAVKKR